MDGRRSAWTPLGLALLCGHCGLSGLAVLLTAFGVVSVPTVLGVDLNWIWPPVVILGGFALYLWTGRRAAEREGAACHRD